MSKISEWVSIISNIQDVFRNVTYKMKKRIPEINLSRKYPINNSQQIALL